VCVQKRFAPSATAVSVGCVWERQSVWVCVKDRETERECVCVCVCVCVDKKTHIQTLSFPHTQNYRSLLQNIVSFVGLFCRVVCRYDVLPVQLLCLSGGCSVCVRERERERGRESVCVCVRALKRCAPSATAVSVGCACEKERVCVCVRERKREREFTYVCVCV